MEGKVSDMRPLSVLLLALLCLWGFGIWQRDRRAAFMREWLHVPLLAALAIFVLVLGEGLRQLLA